MVKTKYVLKNLRMAEMKFMLMLFILMDLIALYFILSIIGRAGIFYIIFTSISAILLNIFYFFYFFDMFVPYIIEIDGKKLKIITKRKRLLKMLDLCTIDFPVINLRYIYRDEFLRKNRKVHLVIENEEKTESLTIGRGFGSHGMIPMREAVEIENWLKDAKERLCEE